MTDSLSLPQLRQLVSQFPKTEQRAYDFHYQDAEGFEAEVDEWFHYTELEQDRDYLLASLDAFEQKFKAFCEDHELPDDTTWPALSQGQRRQFVTHLLDDLADQEYDLRVEALCCVYYILTGVWSTTSGLEVKQDVSNDDIADDASDIHSNVVQVQWMHKGATLLAEASLIPQLYTCLIRAAAALTQTKIHNLLTSRKPPTEFLAKTDIANSVYAFHASTLWWSLHVFELVPGRDSRSELPCFLYNPTS